MYRIAVGVAMVLANPNAGQSLDADFHSVPTVHVEKAAGDAIRAYAATAGVSRSKPGLGRQSTAAADRSSNPTPLSGRAEPGLRSRDADWRGKARCRGLGGRAPSQAIEGRTRRSG